MTPPAAAASAKHFAQGAVSNVGGVMLSNGTVWSHAVTLGRFRYKGEWMEVTPAKVRNFVRVFREGWPNRVPVDYEHNSFNPQGATPKAGTICELRAVLSESDVTPEIQAVVDAHRAWAAEKGVQTTASPLGLWIRWEPVARALTMVREREYTEMSVEFWESVVNPQTGEDQGAAVTAVALTNRPFVQGESEMIRVAARGDGAAPAPGEAGGAPTPNREGKTMKLLTQLSALFGRAVETEDDAATAARAAIEQRDEQVRTLSQTVTSLRAHEQTVTALSQALGVEPAKLGETVGELSQKVRASEQAAKEARARAFATHADAVIAKAQDEGRFAGGKPQSDRIRARLLSDLEAGQEPGKTEAEADIADLPKGSDPTGQHSAADGGQNAPTSTPDRLAKRTAEIEESDPQVKELAARGDRLGAFRLAQQKAWDEVKAIA